MAFLDEKAVELDQFGKELEAAHLDLGDAEVGWEEAKDEALLELAEEYEAKGERLPGEDVRNAMARRRTGFDIYRRWRKADRKVKAIEGRVRRVEKAVTARQSTLKRMEEESKAPTFDPKTGEVFGRRG